MVKQYMALIHFLMFLRHLHTICCQFANLFIRKGDCKNAFTSSFEDSIVSYQVCCRQQPGLQKAVTPLHRGKECFIKTMTIFLFLCILYSVLQQNKNETKKKRHFLTHPIHISIEDKSMHFKKKRSFNISRCF